MTRAGLCLAALGALIVSAASGCNGPNARRRAEPAIDETKWLDRLRQLQPIRFCPIVPGRGRPPTLAAPARPVDNPNASGPASKLAAMVCYRHTGLINDGQNTCGSPWSVPAISA
jgi:hypothetical protein